MKFKRLLLVVTLATPIFLPTTTFAKDTTWSTLIKNPSFAQAAFCSSLMQYRVEEADINYASSYQSLASWKEEFISQYISLTSTKATRNRVGLFVQNTMSSISAKLDKKLTRDSLSGKIDSAWNESSRLWKKECIKLK